MVSIPMMTHDRRIARRMARRRGWRFRVERRRKRRVYLLDVPVSHFFGKALSQYIGTYVLGDDDATPVPAGTLEWAMWRECHPERVRTALDHVGEARVSTVFLGIDHSFGGDAPLLWETMVFWPDADHLHARYSTRDAALAGHAEAVAMLRLAPVVKDIEEPRGEDGGPDGVRPL